MIRVMWPQPTVALNLVTHVSFEFRSELRVYLREFDIGVHRMQFNRALCINFRRASGDYYHGLA